MSVEPPRNTCKTVEWAQLRRSLLGRLREDMARKRVDEEIVPILAALNSSEVFVTASSCSGRIAVFAAPSPQDKKRGGIIAAWHRPVTLREFTRALADAMKTGHPYVWASAQPPLLALHTCRFSCADEAADVAARHGFKYSGYRYLRRSKSYYMVIRGQARIDVPFRAGSREILSSEPQLLERIVYVLNLYHGRARRELGRLASAVREFTKKCRST